MYIYIYMYIRVHICRYGYVAPRHHHIVHCCVFPGCDHSTVFMSPSVEMSYLNRITTITPTHSRH